MKKILTIVTASLLAFTVNAQEDAKAKEILDKLSAKTKSYTTIKADFTYTMVNKSDGINESQDGKIEIKGNKYFLSIQGQDIISDGKNIWTFLKESEEVQINSINEDDDEGISPNKIFTLYEEGFKYKFVEEKNGIQTINLYPKEANEKAYHRITLFIDTAKNQIKEVKVFGKDGTDSSYKIKTFTPNTSISDAHFSFDKSKHPNVEIIDLRE